MIILIPGTSASRVDALGLGNFPDRGCHQSYKNLRVARSEAVSLLAAKTSRLCQLVTAVGAKAVMPCAVDRMPVTRRITPEMVV